MKCRAVARARRPAHMAAGQLQESGSARQTEPQSTAGLASAEEWVEEMGPFRWRDSLAGVAENDQRSSSSRMLDRTSILPPFGVAWMALRSRICAR